MTQPCPGDWQYEQHAKRVKLVASQVESFLKKLRKVGAAMPTALDTRPAHGEIFRGLTPPHFPYFAGHYRGEPFRCLDDYRVVVRGDHRVGALPAVVKNDMDDLSTTLRDGFAKNDAVVANAAVAAAAAKAAVETALAATTDAVTIAQINTDAELAKVAARAAVLINLVRFACLAFDVFLRIHPYANGNGHCGRLLVWAILGRYGFWPRQFTIEPRPNEPLYLEMIVKHRDGDRQPLVDYIFKQLT